MIMNVTSHSGPSPPMTSSQKTLICKWYIELMLMIQNVKLYLGNSEPFYNNIVCLLSQSAGCSSDVSSFSTIHFIMFLLLSQLENIWFLVLFFVFLGLETSYMSREHAFNVAICWKTVRIDQTLYKSIKLGKNLIRQTDGVL